MTQKDPWSSRVHNSSGSLYHKGAVSKRPQKKSLLSKALKIIWLAVKKTCTVLGAVLLVSAVLVLWSFSSVVQESVTPLPEKMVLYIEFNGNIGELPRDVSFTDPFAGQGTTLKAFLDAIDAAKTDPRVKGIYASLKQGGYSTAHIQEIRQALAEFRESGKFAYIHATSYEHGLGGYYLASAFDEIWMQPMGIVAIGGLNIEIPYFRSLLDKIGIEPQFFQRKEYKNAYESVTNKEMSVATQESTTKLIGDLQSVIVTEIAQDRGFDTAAFNEYVDQALFLQDDAIKSGLIDKVAYADSIVEEINEKATGTTAGSGLTYIDIFNYKKHLDRQKQAGFAKQGAKSKKPKVALVYVVGAIVDSETQARASGFMDDGFAGADEIYETLLGIAKDDNIKAVVLRVDSPGGSPVASETILRGVEKVQAKGKKVIVSMGPTAASGGYWVSAYADQIFAMPTTLTGSIGVLGGKVSARELWDKIGVNWARLQWGENAGMWSMNTPFSESEAARMNAMLDNIYDGFLDRVSKGRDLPRPAVEKIARGRVWTGKSAVSLGLADQLGGLNDALDYVAVGLGQENRRGVDVMILPRPQSPIEQFIELLETQARMGEVMAVQGALIKRIAPSVSQGLLMQDAQNSVYTPISVH